MTITYPLTMPAVPQYPGAVTLGMADVIGVSSSGFTLQQEVQKFTGQMWTAQFSLNLLTRAKAGPWIAFLAALKGQYGTFLLGDPIGAMNGVGGGSPVVNGSNAARSSTLAIRGLSTGITGIFKAGDYLQITGARQRLYMVLTDANGDVNGHATVDVWPDLRDTYADGTPIVTASPQGTFRLADNKRGWQETVGGYYSISFSAVEAQ